MPLPDAVRPPAKAQLFEPGDHGSTFGGNPVTTAAALAAIKFIEIQKILHKVEKQGAYLMQELAVIPGVAEVRGAGLLIGLTLDAPIAKTLTKKCQKSGALINAPGESTIRLAPALNVSMKQAEKFVAIFAKAMKEVSHV